MTRNTNCERNNYAVEQRLRLIDFLLAQYGHVNRSAVERYFGVSTPQASHDLGAYARLAPGNMRYCVKQKAYVREAGFAPYWS